LDSPPGEHIARGVARGAALLIGARLATRLIDFMMLIVLGRLLTPVDFGLVAIAMTLVLIVEAIMEMPVSVVLLRASTSDKKRLDTAFSIGLLRGLAVAAILCALAWPLSQIYEDQRLLLLTCVLSLAPAFRGLQSPRMAAYAQTFSFAREFTIEVAAKAAAFTVSVTIALETGSYWALALGTVIAPLTMCLLSYLLAPYRPNFSLSAWREFAGLLGWNTAAQTIAALNWQWDQMVLGKFASRTQLGHFTMANTLALLPVQVIIVQLLRPLTSAFALLHTEKERLTTAYRFSAQSLQAIAIPTLIGLSMLAEPVLRLLLGPQWIAAAPILTVLALSIIPMTFIAALQPLAMILDRTSAYLRVSLAELLIKAPLSLIAAMQFGVTGVLVVRVFALSAVALYGMYEIRKLIGLPILSQILSAWRLIAGGLAMGLIIWEITPFSAGLEGLVLAAWLILTAMAGALVYAVTVAVLWLLTGRASGVEEKAISLVGTRAARLLKRDA
jgi:O-antigen/teichoic acid export membrane protein